MSHHTLAEGLGLGINVVGVLCSRHARILQETAAEMQLAPAEEPESLESEEDGLAEVERIIKHRDHKLEGLQYKVRWMGCNNTRNSWVRLADLSCPELLASFLERQRQRGAPDDSVTDAQAEKFYYGPRSDDVKEKVVVHDGFELPANRHKVSAGPQHTAPWVRPVQTRSRQGSSVFRDQEGTSSSAQGIIEPRYQPMTLMRATPPEQTQRMHQPGGKGFAIGGKGKGKGTSPPAPIRGPSREHAPNDGMYMGASLADMVDAAAQRGGARRVQGELRW